MPIFVSGELSREIARRGMSQISFAYAAGLSPSVVHKACRGEVIRAKTWAAIIRSLAAIEPVDALVVK
jgi:predicted transcriptional regulator